MGNECCLASTTAHLPQAEQNLARYKLRIVEPPRLPLERKPSADSDGPDIEPNLWMWVKPDVVFPPGKLAVAESEEEEEEDAKSTAPSPQRPPEEEQEPAPGPGAWGAEPQPPCGEQAAGGWELPEEEEAEDQDDSSSVALPPPHSRAPLQSRRLRQGQASSPEGRLWSRPPLNYFHLIALALRNSPPCGLNVQQIYSFTRQHFPFFRTAPEGWKNTVRHNLCFRDSFEKVPAGLQGEASPRPRSCLWKLTQGGHRRFAEEVRSLAAARLDSIRQCMSQPDMMAFLFDL